MPDLATLTEQLCDAADADGVTLQWDGLGWCAWPYRETGGEQVALVSEAVEVHDTPERAVRAAIRLVR